MIKSMPRRPKSRSGCRERSLSRPSIPHLFCFPDMPISWYSFAFFSGLTTLEISRVLTKIIKNNKFYRGLYNISSKKISKFHLLEKINKIYNLNKIISKDKKFKIDRSLNSLKFKNKFKINVSSWDKQISDMYKDYKKNKKLYLNEI